MIDYIENFRCLRLCKDQKLRYKVIFKAIDPTYLDCDCNINYISFDESKFRLHFKEMTISNYLGHSVWMLDGKMNEIFLPKPNSHENINIIIAKAFYQFSRFEALKSFK